LSVSSTAKRYEIMNDARQNVPSLCHYPKERSKIAKKGGKGGEEKIG
jgi:hypothetical protein